MTALRKAWQRLSDLFAVQRRQDKTVLDLWLADRENPHGQR